MRDQPEICCGLGIQDRLVATDWVMRGSSFEEVFECLDHENMFVSMTASTLVDRNREEAIPLLLDQAKNGTNDQRIMALSWLRGYGPDSLGVIADLEQMLDEDDLAVRMHVVQAVCTINPDSEAVIPVLMEMLVSDNQAERTIVPWGLRTVNLPAEEVIPILINLLEDDYEHVRSNSAVMLGQYGSRAEEAIPALENALESTEDPWVRERISEAIEKIQNPLD